MTTTSPSAPVGGDAFSSLLADRDPCVGHCDRVAYVFYENLRCVRCRDVDGISCEGEKDCDEKK
jgi:hypothetical protein